MSTVWNHQRLEELWRRVGRIDTTATAAAAAAGGGSSTGATLRNFTSYGSIPAASTLPGEVVTLTDATSCQILVSVEVGTGNGFEWKSWIKWSV